MGLGKEYELAIFEERKEVHHVDSDCVEKMGFTYDSDAVKKQSIIEDLKEEGYKICECLNEED